MRRSKSVDASKPLNFFDSPMYLDQWIRAKVKEEKAKAERLRVEEKLSQLFSFDSGNSKTFTEGNYKISLKKNVAYKLDQAGWSAIRDNFPADLRPEKVKFEVDVKGLEYLKANHYDLYKKASDLIEIKENKMTITVEKIKGGKAG